jgi:hypothetical protein
MRWWPLSIFFLLTAFSSLDGQQAAPSNRVSYEGHMVGAVDLVANPKIPIDSCAVRPDCQMMRRARLFSRCCIRNGGAHQVASSRLAIKSMRIVSLNPTVPVASGAHVLAVMP